MALRRQGKIDEKVFAETRLRRGVYGQRYDNGQRHDGIASQAIQFPCGTLTKGPDTAFDAPGMQRIKVPYGGMTVKQLEILADVAEEYSDGILHVTTRQDIQLHFVHIEDTPDIMRRLSAVGITTQEACGNSIRNITGCPTAGVCHDEAFDVSPYAKAMTAYLLGHPDVQDFGRKFKIAFSGCGDKPCGLVMIHDLGCIAQIKHTDGKEVRGFKVFIGGGLGTVPHQAKLLSEFVTEEELLPLTQAVARVFARLGEKKNRNRARLKFLIAKMGIEEFREKVTEERSQLPHDPRWTAYIDELLPHYRDEPLKKAQPLALEDRSKGFQDWYKTNVYQQRQKNYSTVTIYLPLGDLTSEQTRQLASAALVFGGAESIRTTVEENDFAVADQKAYQSMLMAAIALLRTQILDVKEEPSAIVQEFKERFYDTKLFFDRFAKGKFAHYLFDRSQAKNRNGGPNKEYAHRLVEEAQLFIEASHACESRITGTSQT